jgi:class 3 adenylate cyclase/tetratricopeptide (TPR) repeat protein
MPPGRTCCDNHYVATDALCSVLVRRDDQLATLEDALLEARRGHGGLVVLAGEAGIGKTRLADELSHQARRLGSAVLWGGCSEAELSLPYLPFVEAIGNYLADQDVGEVAARLGPTSGELSQLFPQFRAAGSATPASDPGQAKLRLFEAIVALLAVPAADRTLLLVIEDVHWADDSSRELLDHLARRLAGVRALVLVTYRSDELHRRHPFVPTLRAWRRSGLARVIDLDPLPQAGIAEMLASITGTDQVEPELVDLLYERTEGNPFFVEEMLSEASCSLGPGEEITRAALDSVGIPETVRDTILQRLARLDPEHVEVLEVAAVMGRRFTYDTLLAVSGAPEDVTQAALSSALAVQLIEEHPQQPGHYRWRHALTEESIHDEVVSPRRQAIHSRAADVLAADGSYPPIEIANHLLWAGRFEEAVPIVFESADQAERATAFREAASVLERVIPHISDPLERAKVVCRIGKDLALNGESEPAAGFLADGIQALEELGEPLIAARYRIILGRCHWERAQPEAARVEYVRARDVLADAGPSAELAMAYVRLAGLDVFELDFAGCLKHSRSAVEIAEAAGADYERVYALSFLALGYIDAGEPERGLEILDEAYQSASANDYFHIAQNITWNDIWSRVHLRRGDLESRLERLKGLPAWPLLNGAIASASVYVHLARGKLEAAREQAELAIDLHDRLGYRKMGWRGRVHLAEVLMEMGRYNEAAAVLPPTSERTELQDIVYDAPAQIRVRLARGEIDDALELAREIRDRAVELAVHRDPLAVAVEAFIAGRELESAEEVLERTRAHPADVASSFLDEMQGRIHLGRGEGAHAVRSLRSTIEAAQREGYVLVELRMRALLGEALGLDGERDAAEQELSEVIAEASQLGAGRITDEARGAAERIGLELGDVVSEPVARPAEPELVPAGERLVTSLFADVRGYADLVAADAPAEVAGRMAAFYRFARSAVERRGGVVDKFAGDAVMATFNVSGRSVDHVVDAVESALTLRDKAALTELPLGIGIATGAAILGRGASEENLAVRGVATNLAARLQDAAGPGEILLSDEAHRRVDAWLRERGAEPEREELSLKGFDDPQGAYRLPAPSSMPASASETSSPIVSSS